MSLSNYCKFYLRLKTKKVKIQNIESHIDFEAPTKRRIIVQNFTAKNRSDRFVVPAEKATGLLTIEYPASKKASYDLITATRRI